MKLEEYQRLIFHPKTDKYRLLRVLKQEGDLIKILKIYKNISSHPFVKSTIKNNLRPITYKDIRRQKPIPFSGNFIGEASFYLIILNENKKLLNSFLQYKKEFEVAFLLEEYDKAEIFLNKIESLSGKSHWLIENKLLLREYKDGVQANWNTVSELSETVKDPIVLFFIENFSKKAETKISYFRYLNIFNNQVNELQVHHPMLYEYLCFRLNYSAFIGCENLAYMLFIESSLPIVDRYLLLREILVELVSAGVKEQEETLKLIALNLFEIFSEDTQLCQILSTIDCKFLSFLPKNPQISKIIREYSIGNYLYCRNNAKNLIFENPNIVEIYEIFVKSLIEDKIEPNFEIYPIHIKNILSVLYKIYSSQDNIEQTIDFGLKLCTSFSSTNWARQILSLIKSSTSTNNGNKLFTVQYLLNSEIPNPRVLYYVKNNNIDCYAEFFQKNTDLFEPTNSILNILKGNHELVMQDIYLTKSKKELHYGRALMNSLKFQEAKEYFENLYTIAAPSSALYEEELIVNLFRCYIKLNLYTEACCLFVKQYLKRKETTKRLNKHKLLENIENGGLDNLSTLIELPIFYKITSIDSYQQYVAYDTFMEKEEVTRPTELIDSLVDFDDKIIFFLKEVCTIEIMHHSYYFNGTDDIENERLKILNRLIVIDKLNEDEYIKEITELNQNTNIRKAIREVNKGRISVNIQQLRKNETNNVKEAFNRYKEMENYSKNNELLGIDTSSSMLNEISNANLDELLGTTIVYVSDPAFISFKVIFLEIRDKFLLSKEYGLDGYLSTRIRHGTLLNHIRSIFESENIISQRDKENIYLENEFWNIALPLNLLDKRLRIQEAIKKFSKSIDEYTEYILKELIQVKTEKHSKKPKALFDYSISNQELAILFAAARGNIKDHNLFLSFVFDYLQRFTEKILSRIRVSINTEIKDNYNSILQDFNTEVKDIIGSSAFPELTNAIGLCGTRLQNELKSISEWFFLSSTSKELILDLKVLIQTAVQITNTISPNSKLNPKIYEEHSKPILGPIHLIYICRILLDNIIIHSKVSSNEFDIEIVSKSTEDYFWEISFKNNLSNEIDQDDLKRKLQLVKNKWAASSSDFENIDIEGGSGFDKIRRIIAFDLGIEYYKFDFKLTGIYLTITLSIGLSNIPQYDDRN